MDAREEIAALRAHLSEEHEIEAWDEGSLRQLRATHWAACFGPVHCGWTTGIDTVNAPVPAVPKSKPRCSRISLNHQTYSEPEPVRCPNQAEVIVRKFFLNLATVQSLVCWDHVGSAVSPVALSGLRWVSSLVIPLSDVGFPYKRPALHPDIEVQTEPVATASTRPHEDAIPEYARYFKNEGATKLREYVESAPASQGPRHQAQEPAEAPSVPFSPGTVVVRKGMGPQVVGVVLDPEAHPDFPSYESTVLSLSEVPARLVAFPAIGKVQWTFISYLYPVEEGS